MLPRDADALRSAPANRQYSGPVVRGATTRMRAASLGPVIATVVTMVAGLLQVSSVLAAEALEFPPEDGASPRESCELEGGGAGECRPLSECPSAVEQRRRGGHPQLCGFPSGAAGAGVTSMPHVCCPALVEHGRTARPRPEPSPSCAAFNETVVQDAGSGPGSAARRMCMQYQKQICTGEVSREDRTPSVAFGAFFGPADQMEYPHMALLGFGEKDDIQYACGGSLISPDFVLTAAHCIASGASPVRWVLLGALNRSESLADKATRQLLEVAQAIPHPQYSARERYHDIALLRLATSARVEEGNVRPACLHTELDGDLDGNTDTLRGELAVVTGWGAEAFGEDGSERLLKGNVSVRALAECSRGSKGLDAKLPRGLDPETHVCAGGDGTNPTDACNGDSGGPLQFPALQKDPTCMFRVAGVVSFGPPCGLGLPGVYTKVAYYVPWIEGYVWPSPDNSTGDDCVPGTGPGTTARRACQRYLRRFCGRSLSFRTAMPGLREMERCHLQETVPPTPAGISPPPPPPASGTGQVGFEVADDAEFPHQVLLSYGRDEDKETECSGVLIAPDYVLTAAHCAKLGFGCGGPVRQVLFGKRDRTSLPIETVDVAAVVVHPEYDRMNRHNDVALLRLAQPVRLGFQSRPACLQTHGDDDVLAGPLTASGMTATGRWEDVGGGMRKVAVAAENATACKARIASLKRDKDSLKYFTIPGLRHNIGLEQLCTKEGAPTVPGDIGSPIQVVHRVLDGLVVHRVAGILSQRSLCGSGLPDVYTNVADVVPWIESVVWPET